MEAYPIHLGVTKRGDIITISPDQVEELVAAFRVAVETRQRAVCFRPALKRHASHTHAAGATTSR